MFIKFSLICLLVFTSTIDFCWGDVSEKRGGLQAKPRKYNLSICAVFNDEARYLKEWIEYHRLIGVDHFYLYNNDSTDESVDVLMPYVKNQIVTLTYWPNGLGFYFHEDDGFTWTLSTQIPAYENAAKYLAVNQTEWLVFLDVDEFLVPSKYDTLTKILESYPDCPGVRISSDFFDASKRDTPRKRNLVIQTTELTKPPEENAQKAIEKTIFRPEFCESFIWPPYRWVFKYNQCAVDIPMRKLRINRYINRYKDYSEITVTSKPKLPIDNRMLTEDATKELLEAGYEIEDQERVIFRFLPELFRKMGYKAASGW